MGKLSDLVKFRSTLLTKANTISLDDPINSIICELNLVVTENPTVDKFTIHDKINTAVVEYKKLTTQSSIIKNFLLDSIVEVDEKIDQTARELSVEINNCQPFQVFELDENTNQLVIDKMQKYADWSFPGLRFGCRYAGQSQIELINEVRQYDYHLSSHFSNYMVANDPLYFCDVDESLITNVTEQFNSIYSNRIRKYVISDNNLTELPKNQFGFIFSWWFFNFVDIVTMEQYLTDIFNLLRPGGTLMFSYNNSDLPESAKLVDMKLMTHTPYRHISKLCQKLGFEITSCHDEPNSDSLVQYISWVEIKKPGNLQTVKLKQVLGQISTK